MARRAPLIPFDSLTGRGIQLLALGERARWSWRRHTGGRRMLERLDAFYGLAWENAAAATGALLTHIDGGMLAIDLDGQRLLVANSTTSLDDPVTLRVAGDKPLVHRLIAAQGVPTPRYTVCSARDFASAWSFVSHSSQPCVVKPARSTGAGNGVTAGVRTKRQLLGALAAAARLCDDAIVEKQLEGDNFRMLYLDGELIDAVCRRPPVVHGDGVHTLKQLIAVENRRRLTGGMAASQTLVPIDRDLHLTLRAGGWRLRSIPSAGEVVRLRTVVNDNRREDNRAAMHLLCPSVIESGATAARAIGVRLAGVDVITPDPSLPLAACGGAVIEVNTTPGHYHHFTDPADPGRAAKLILERLAAGRGAADRPSPLG